MIGFFVLKNKILSHSVEVNTSDFESESSGSNPGGTTKYASVVKCRHARLRI